MNSSISFKISVAFINFSGVQLLLDALKSLEEKDIKGVIITSTYLNFTEVSALRRLSQFKNIELRVYQAKSNEGFHAKSYIFEQENQYKIVVGSSNITASAFKSNIEWNQKTTTNKDDRYLARVLCEFENIYLNSIICDDSFLKSYQSFLDNLSSQRVNKKFEYKQSLKQNYMQEKALLNLKKLRTKGEKRALVIASTGSGKTYLSAFDVKNFEANRVLFLVHRENILIKAKQSFENIIADKKMGILSANFKQMQSQYLFSTIQSMNNYYKEFVPEYFDYIVIDEAHHASAVTYTKLIEYFTPKFLLGLSATPNRGDGKSIYEVFDDNIAIDIRIRDALKYDLIVPFHYFGVSDIELIDYEKIDTKDLGELCKALSINSRVRFILEKMNFYGYDGNKRRVLAFCVNVSHAKFMSEEFNNLGVNSLYLSSSDSIDYREKSIRRLEDSKDKLEVIFTVDIFNEGVDIPSVNTILMLRPTESATIFIQQLGRGLRKHSSKEYLTIIDFIGNHSRAFLVTIALLGKSYIDKESLKLALKNSFADIPNNSFVSLDKISTKRILEQIEKENFSSFKYLKDEYLEFKKSIGNITPSLVDFIAYSDTIEPMKFINENKSYIEFVDRVEMLEFELSTQFKKAIRFIESLLPLKRVYEFVILKELIEKKSLSIKIATKALDKYLDEVDEDTIFHSFRFLSSHFLDSGQLERYLVLANIEKDELKLSSDFEKLLENNQYKQIIKSTLEYGVLRYELEFSRENFGIPFLKLYEKYSMKDIALVCNLDKIHSSFRGSGQLKFQDDYFLFINLEKENAYKSKRYENAFLDNKTLTWQSKPNCSQDSADGQRLTKNKENRVRLHIFVRKFVTVDKITQSFIYLGKANTIKYEKQKPIHLTLELENSLDDRFYEEFTVVI